MGREVGAEGAAALGHTAPATRQQRGKMVAYLLGAPLLFPLSSNSRSPAQRTVPVAMKIDKPSHVNIIKIIPPRCAQGLTLI